MHRIPNKFQREWCVYMHTSTKIRLKRGTVCILRIKSVLSDTGFVIMLLKKLPPELIVIILNFVGETDVTLEQIVALHTVSKDIQHHMKTEFTSLGMRLTGHLFKTEREFQKAVATFGAGRFHWSALGLWCLSSVNAITTVRYLNLTRHETLVNVNALANAYNLHTLDLSFCTKLTTVDGLATAPALHTLDLSRCTGLVNVDGLATAPALHTLDLSFCTGLINELVIAPTLHTLDLYGCTGLTNIDELATASALHLHVQFHT